MCVTETAITLLADQSVTLFLFVKDLIVFNLNAFSDPQINMQLLQETRLLGLEKVCWDLQLYCQYQNITTRCQQHTTENSYGIAWKHTKVIKPIFKVELISNHLYTITLLDTHISHSQHFKY